MGMYDTVRFSEKISKELDLPYEEFQTKDFDCQMDKFEISELIHKNGNHFKESIIFECYAWDSLNYFIAVTVVVGNGIVLKCSKASSRGRSGWPKNDNEFGIMPKLVCPSCKMAGCVFSENTSIKCGSCKSDLALAVEAI